MKDFCTLEINIQGMKHQLVHAFMGHSEELKAQIEQACDSYIESGRLKRQIEDEFAKAVDEELKAYFGYGAGRQAVRETVAVLFKKDSHAE